MIRKKVLLILALTTAASIAFSVTACVASNNQTMQKQLSFHCYLFVSLTEANPLQNVCHVNYNYTNPRAWVVGLKTIAIPCCPLKA